MIHVHDLEELRPEIRSAVETILNDLCSCRHLLEEAVILDLANNLEVRIQVQLVLNQRAA